MKQNAFYWNFFRGSIKKSLNERLSPPLTKEIMNSGKKEYCLLIDHAPELGKGNPFSLNMYFACVFIGVWLGSDKVLSPGTMADIMTECLIRLKPFFGIDSGFESLGWLLMYAAILVENKKRRNV